MERLIRYGSVDSIPFYNCSWKTTEEWNSMGLKRPVLGWFMVLFGGIVEILYIPILYIIFKDKLIRYSCYKLIVFLALTDMCAVVCSSIIGGFLYIQGAVFCSYPTFEYIAGGFAINTWCMACAINISLFANRVCSIAFHEYMNVIEKKLTYISIFISAVYGAYILMYTPVICFNSAALAWISQPLSEKEESRESEEYYDNQWQSWNNYVFVAIMFFLYITYCVLVKKLAQGQSSKKSRAIFIQCAVICFFNTVTAVVYNVLSLMTPALWVLYLGQLCWCINHGCPAIIYLTMNDTIRSNFFRIFNTPKRSKLDNTTYSGQNIFISSITPQHHIAI